MSESLSLSFLAATLLRAAAEGRLHRIGLTYRWRPRTAVSRAHSSPGITETGTQLHAFGLISHHPDDTTCALTQRGWDVLAAYNEGKVRRVR